MADGIGLSIGATTLRAVAVGRSVVTRSPVLTLYPHRPSEVGVPSENPNLAERGLIITDFVDRVGDPVAIVAGDGTSHRAEDLLADALRALLQALTGDRPPSEPVGVTHPAHWSPSAVQALRGALAAQPGLSDAPLTSDALTALTALQDDPGVPSRGIVALCDVGGSGASITLANAANGFAPIGPTVRHPDLSGDSIDQALLTHVVGELGSTGAVDLSSTSAIGSLSRLRGQCRAAKERLSTSAVTSMPIDLPGHRTDVRMTRVELDDAIRAPLAGFIDVLREMLQGSGIGPNDLAAVASVGGGARLPILTTTLSESLRVPVITFGQPELAAAIGGGLTAVRGLTPDGATSMAPAAVAPVVAAPVDPAAPGSSTFRPLAWSDAGDIAEPVPADPAMTYQRPVEPADEPFDPRPPMAFADRDEDDAPPAPLPWYRTPVAMAALGLVAVAAVITGGALYFLQDDESPAATPTPASSPATPTSGLPPASDAPAQESQPPGNQAPGQQTVIEQAPAPVVTVTAPPPGTETPPPPPPATTEPPPTTVQTTIQTTTVTQPPSSNTQQPVIPTLPYQTIPGLPFVPAPIQPAQP